MVREMKFETDRLCIESWDATLGSEQEKQAFAAELAAILTPPVLKSLPEPMFVCLKNIFASESFDDIILREFAGLDGGPQDIYKHVAAMETLGVRVHRQLAIRMLKIEPSRIASILESLDDIVEEYPIEKRHGEDALRVAGFAKRPDLTLWSQTAQKYNGPETGPEALREAGFLQVSARYLTEILD